MTCNEASLLIDDHVDGACDPVTAAAVDHHLSTCEGCRALAADLSRIRAAARTSASAATATTRLYDVTTNETPVTEVSNSPIRIVFVNDVPAGNYLIQQTNPDCTDWSLDLARVSGG